MTYRTFAVAVASLGAIFVVCTTAHATCPTPHYACGGGCNISAADAAQKLNDEMARAERDCEENERRDGKLSDCPVFDGDYRKVDLDTHAIFVTPKNRCAHVEVITGIRVMADKPEAFIQSRPFAGEVAVGAPPVKLLLNLTNTEIEYLRESCPEYIRCIARWRITLLRQDPSSGMAVVSLDGFQR